MNPIMKKIIETSILENGISGTINLLVSQGWSKQEILQFGFTEEEFECVYAK